VNVKSKLDFGNRGSDFVVRRSDGTYVVIEIERANERIFQRKNSEPSAAFNHACQQVYDWQRYIRDNVHTVRNELGLDGIYEPSGMVIMGRSSAIDSDIARVRWRDLKGDHEPQVFTYDEIIERTRALADSLRHLL
jgi:hypothetical protein